MFFFLSHFLGWVSSEQVEVKFINNEQLCLFKTRVLFITFGVFKYDSKSRCHFHYFKQQEQDYFLCVVPFLEAGETFNHWRIKVSTRLSQSSLKEIPSKSTAR